jgi:hypothetical protein
MSYSLGFSDWELDVSIPFIDLDDSDSSYERIAKKKLLRKWMKHNDISPEDAIKIIERIIICPFERQIQNDNERIRSTVLVGFNTSKYQDSNPASLFMLVCIEKMKSKKKHIITQRMYLLGFISYNSIAIKLSDRLGEGSIFHGIETQHDMMIFPFDKLWRNHEKLLESSQEMEQEEKEEEDTGIDFGSISLREEPTSWIYIFRADPPTKSEHDLSFFKHNDLETIVMKRLKVLCDVYNDLHEKEKTTKDYQLKELPISNREHMTRDRMCILFLINAFCMDDTLSEWYVQAEAKMMMNNLSRLCDYEDKLLTLKNNDTNVNLNDINFWNSFEQTIVMVHQTGITNAINASKEYFKKFKKENEKRKVDDVEYIELVSRCKTFAYTHLEVQEESDDSDNESEDE